LQVTAAVLDLEALEVAVVQELAVQLVLLPRIPVELLLENKQICFWGLRHLAQLLYLAEQLEEAGEVAQEMVAEMQGADQVLLVTAAVLFILLQKLSTEVQALRLEPLLQKQEPLEMAEMLAPVIAGAGEGLVALAVVMCIFIIISFLEPLQLMLLM